MEKIKYVIQIILIRLTAFFIEKDNKIWVFGGKTGASFTDNSMYFYKYISEDYPDVIPIWIANNDETIKIVEEYGGKAYKKFSFKAFFYIIRAKVFITSHFISSDIGIYDDRNTIFVNLWHGMPIKKIVYDTQTTEKETTIFSKAHNLLRYNMLQYKDPRDLGDIICSTSEYTKRYMESAFRSDNVFVTGQLRGDKIYEQYNKKEKKLLVKDKNSQKLIVYMPTHRAWGKETTNNIFDNEKNYIKIQEVLEEYDCILAIKLHPNEKESINDFKRKRIIDISAENISVEDLLVETDLLITDYSSCFIDFALMKRPILFYAYDLEKYKKFDMGLYIEYGSELPGPIIKTEEKLIEQIKRYITDQGSEIYLKEYGDKLKKYNYFFDNDSGLRITNKIFEILEK